MSKEILYQTVSYTCPICGKPLSKIKLSREFIHFLGRNKYGYQLVYNCRCAEKISQIIDWKNSINNDFTDGQIANCFNEADKKAIADAKRNAGIITEGDE